MYKIDEEQSKILNSILNNPNSKLKNGDLSRGTIKRDRIECPIEEYKYSPTHKKGCKNCVSWLYLLFPNLKKDCDGIGK